MSLIKGLQKTNETTEQNNRKCIYSNIKENTYNNIKEKKEELENKLLLTTLKKDKKL